MLKMPVEHFTPWTNRSLRPRGYPKSSLKRQIHHRSIRTKSNQIKPLQSVMASLSSSTMQTNVALAVYVAVENDK